jgi:hypothetical protein
MILVNKYCKKKYSYVKLCGTKIMVFLDMTAGNLVDRHRFYREEEGRSLSRNLYSILYPTAAYFSSEQAPVTNFSE